MQQTTKEHSLVTIWGKDEANKLVEMLKQDGYGDHEVKEGSVSNLFNIYPLSSLSKVKLAERCIWLKGYTACLCRDAR